MPNVLTQLSGSLNPDGSPHSSIEGHYDPTRTTTGTAKPVTIVDQLTFREAALHKTRIELLVATGIVGDFNQLTFTFRATDSAKIAANSIIYLTASKGVLGDGNPRLNTDQNYWKEIDGKLAYVCASMVELLLCIGSAGSGIYAKGRLGATNGFTGATKDVRGDQGGVSDHTFGRAFDITVVGSSVSDAVELASKNIDNYRKALKTLLAKLDTIPEYLHPDLIIIHDELVTEFGIGNGFESDSTTKSAALVTKQYKNLSRINFTGDSGHRDHIHMSFGPARAGSYADWVAEGTSDSIFVDPESGDSPAGNPNDLTELGANFATSQDKLVNKNALYGALVKYGGYSAEAAAIWMCLAERESNFGVGSFNGQVNNSEGVPRGTSDYSIGLWQVNFYGVSSLLEIDLVLASLDPVKKTIIKEKGRGYKLIDKDWLANGTKDAASAILKMKEWYKVSLSKGPNALGVSEGKIHADSRLWNALTQIFLLEKMSSGLKDGWMWWNWGEYGTEGNVGDAYSDSKRPPAGWLRGLRFQTAVNYYIANNPGKTVEDLKLWVKKKGTDGRRRSTKEFLDRWLEGYVFNVNGTIKEKPKAVVIPKFTKTQIKEAAIWLRINRMGPWQDRNNEAFGCEGFANRLASGLGLLGATVKEEIFTKEWEGAERPESSLRIYSSAYAHYLAVKDSQYFNGPNTDLGKNPPAGYIVFWSGGAGGFGHDGISLGDGTFMDQN